MLCGGYGTCCVGRKWSNRCWFLPCGRRAQRPVDCLRRQVPHLARLTGDPNDELAASLLRGTETSKWLATRMDTLPWGKALLSGTARGACGSPLARFDFHPSWDSWVRWHTASLHASFTLLSMLLLHPTRRTHCTLYRPSSAYFSSLFSNKTQDMICSPSMPLSIRYGRSESPSHAVTRIQVIRWYAVRRRPGQSFSPRLGQPDRKGTTRATIRTQLAH